MFFLVYCMICYSILTKANFLSITSLVVFVRHFSCFIQERRLQTTKIETSLYYLPKIIAEKFSVKQLEILNVNISFWMTESEVVWVCYSFEIRTCWEIMVTKADAMQISSWSQIKKGPTSLETPLGPFVRWNP